MEREVPEEGIGVLLTYIRFSSECHFVEERTRLGTVQELPGFVCESADLQIRKDDDHKQMRSIFQTVVNKLFCRINSVMA